MSDKGNKVVPIRPQRFDIVGFDDTYKLPIFSARIEFGFSPIVFETTTCSDVREGDAVVLCECGLHRASRHVHGGRDPVAKVLPFRR